MATAAQSLLTPPSPTPAPALQALPALDAQKLADRAALKAAIAPPLAAASDIGTAPMRALMGTANLLGRGVNVLLPQGVNISPIPESAFGGNSASLTPYSDALKPNTGSTGGDWGAPAAPTSPAAAGAVAKPADAPLVPAPQTGASPGYDFPPVNYGASAQPGAGVPAAATGTPWSIVKTMRNEDGSAGKVTHYSGMTPAPGAGSAAPVAATPATAAYQQRVADQERIVALAQHAAPGNITAQLQVIHALAGGFTPNSDSAHVAGAEIGAGAHIAGIGAQVGEQNYQFTNTPRIMGGETTMTPFGPVTTSTYGMPAGATSLTAVSPAKPAAKPAEGATGTLKDGRRFVIQNGEPVVIK